ncbi:MAG: MFS transporter [Thermoplasmatales archaeon]
MKDETPFNKGLEPIAAMNNASYTTFHKVLVLIAALGAFTDLYVIQALGASTFSIVPHFLGSTSNFAFTASLLFIGAVIGVFSMGTVVDLIGRRLTFIITLGLTALFSLISAFVQSPLELNILRFLIGFVTGADYPAAMTIVSEFMPTKYRGRGISYLWVGFTLGGVSAYLLGYFLFVTIGPTVYEWRIMLGSAVIPALVGMILRTSLPESPRWAIEKGKYESAANGIKRASGQLFTREALEGSRKALFLDEKVVIRKHYGKYFILILPIFGAVLCFNLIPGALSTLNPSILSSLGVSKSGSLLYSASFLGVQVIATIMIARTIESVGRLKWAMIGGGLETIFAFIVLLVYHDAYALFGVFMGLSFFAFVAVPVMRNSGSELFPTEFRGFSSGVVMTGDRIASVIGLLLTPLLFTGKDVTRLFSVYGLIGLIGTLIAYVALYKKNIDKKSLEDIQLEILK